MAHSLSAPFRRAPLHALLALVLMGIAAPSTAAAAPDDPPTGSTPKTSKKKPARKPKTKVKKEKAAEPAPEAPKEAKEEPKEPPPPPIVTTAAPTSTPTVERVPEPTSITKITSAELPDKPAEPKSTSDAPSPWMFDGGVGVPKLASGSFSLAVDATGGYHGEHLAGAARFAMSTMALEEGSTLTSTSRTQLGIDAGYLTSPSAHRLELRASLGYASYQTSYISMPDAAGGGSPGFSAEGSGLLRASAMVGVRAQESEVLLWKASGGVGIQSESYSRVETGNGTAAGSDAAGGNFNSATSVRLSAHGEARWRVSPGLVAMRPELAASMFSLRRSAFFFGDSKSGATLESSRAIELSLRVNAEIERLELFGFVPALFAGVDFASVSGDAGSTSTIIPLGGVALATTTM